MTVSSTQSTTVLLSTKSAGRTLTAAGLPDGVSPNSWTWTSAPTGIVTIEEKTGTSGAEVTLKPAKKGTATVTATPITTAAPTGDTAKASTFTVKVVEAPTNFAITIDRTALTSTERTLELGKTYSIGYSAGGTVVDSIDGYTVKMAATNTTQGTTPDTYQPLTINETTEGGGIGSITAAHFTSSPVRLTYGNAD